MYKLRDYQQEAVDKTMEYCRNGGVRPIVVLPTGAGKSLVLAAMIQHMKQKKGRVRVLVMSHVKEILEQNHEKLSALLPDIETGFNCAAISKDKDFDSQVIFASVQTVAKNADQLGFIDVVLIDECHRVSADKNTGYARTIKALELNNSKLRVIGVTATPWRTGSGSLVTGKNKIFEVIAYEVKIVDLMKRGYLTQLTTGRTSTRIDTKGIKITAGDYNQGELASRAEDLDLVQSIIDDVEEQAKDRRCMLLFCVSVRHAEMVAEEMNRRGICCGVLTGATPKGERAKMLDDLRFGRIRAISNCSVLTTGIDIASIDVVALCRPTQSLVLFHQMVGRGLRLHNRKSNCMVLDFGGCIGRLGAIDAPLIPKEGKRERKKIRTCKGEGCGQDYDTRLPACPYCGFKPKPKTKSSSSKEMTIRASTLQIIRGEAPMLEGTQWVEYRGNQTCWTSVNGLRVEIMNPKRGGELIKIIFDTDVGKAIRFIDFAPKQYWQAKETASWWRKLSNTPFPVNIDEAKDMISQGALVMPNRIRVSRKPGKNGLKAVEVKQ